MQGRALNVNIEVGIFNEPQSYEKLPLSQEWDNKNVHSILSEMLIYLIKSSNEWLRVILARHTVDSRILEKLEYHVTG